MGRRCSKMPYVACFEILLCAARLAGACWRPTRAQRALPTAVCLALTVGCASVVRDGSTEKASFEEGWRLVRDHYFDPSFGGLDWAAVGERYRARAEAGEGGYRQPLERMLKELKVSHLAVLNPRAADQLRANVQPAPYAGYTGPPTSTQKSTQNSAAGQRALVKVKQFSVTDAMRLCEDIRMMADGPGMTLDLRGNRGGQLSTVAPLLGLFITEPQVYGYLQSRKLRRELRVWPQPYHYAGELEVLIDSRTASVAEIFADALQRLGRARIRGGPSAGQVLIGQLFGLPDGRTLQIPTLAYLTGDGRLLEGIGVTATESVDLAVATGPAVRTAAPRLDERPTSARLIQGSFRRSWGHQQASGQFWLVVSSTADWTYSEEVAAGAYAGTRYRTGRVGRTQWTQHSVEGFRVLPPETPPRQVPVAAALGPHATRQFQVIDSVPSEDGPVRQIATEYVVSADYSDRPVPAERWGPEMNCFTTPLRDDAKRPTAAHWLDEAQCRPSPHALCSSS